MMCCAMLCCAVLCCVCVWMVSLDAGWDPSITAREFRYLVEKAKEASIVGILVR